MRRWAQFALAPLLAVSLGACESHNRSGGPGSSGSGDNPGDAKNTTFFTEICSRGQNPADIQKTIDALKAIAGTGDCQGAEAYFSKVYSLNLSGKGISSLLPIKGFRVLTELLIDNNAIESVDPLSDLRGLTLLSAANNKIKSVSSLALLEKLTNINLDNNQITSIFALKGLPQVQRFSMAQNPLGDGAIKKSAGNCDPTSKSSAIANWCAPSTPFLEICNQGSSADKDDRYTVNVIKAMLKATSCAEANGKLAKTTKLNLSLKQIVSVVPLRGQKQLTQLDLSYNFIKDISALSDLESLTYLLLYSNQLENIDAVRYMKRLTSLNISFNYITDLMPLKDLRYLVYQHDKKDHQALRAEYNPLGCQDFLDSEYCNGRRTPIEKTEYNCPHDAKSDAIADWCRWTSRNGVKR